VCCYDLVSVDSLSLVLYFSFHFIYFMFILIILKIPFKNPLELDYDLISLDLNLL
jgi:hypothetical protein